MKSSLPTIRSFSFYFLKQSDFFSLGLVMHDIGRNALFPFPWVHMVLSNKIIKNMYIFFNNTTTHTSRRKGLSLLAESLTIHSVQTQQGILTTHLTFHLFIFIGSGRGL